MHEAAPSRKSVLPETRTLALVAMLVGNIALAFGPLFVRLTDVGPVAAGFWRIALAAPMLLALAYMTGSRPIRDARGLWGLLALAGLAFAADLGSWHIGIHYTTLANSTLFGNSATLIYPIYGFFVARAWPTRTQGVALVLAAAGAGLLLGSSYQASSAYLMGDLLCLFAGALYTVYFILMARAREAMAPLPALALSTVASILPLLLAASLFGEKIWPDHWGILIGLALASQVIGQGLMIYALPHLPPLVVGIGLLSQPVVSGVIGWWYYGEKLGAADFIGAALVAVALVLVRGGTVASAGAAPKSSGEGAL